jgi:hypothetical protein
MFKLYLLGFWSIFLSVTAVSAQTTIFNVPSTDVTAERKAYLELDFISHFDKLSQGGFQTYGYRVTYGLRKKVEVGTNFFYTRSSSPAFREFQANVKFKALESEKHKFAVSGGAQVFVPLRGQPGQRTVSMLYSNASQVIPRANNLRFTGGIYTMVNAKRDFGTRTGAIVGVEQPVNRKLNLIADWYSGKNRFGYSTAGLSFVATSRQILFAGYNFGNAGRANNSFSFYYGYNF